MDYKDLQKKAKELGLPYIGVSRSDLEKAIKEKEASSDVVANDEALAQSEKMSSEPTATALAKEAPYNTAVVLDKEGREVRRYSFDLHGEKWAELADEFAKKNDYRVEMKSVEEGIRCPSCGYVFHPLD